MKKLKFFKGMVKAVSVITALSMLSFAPCVGALETEHDSNANAAKISDGLMDKLKESDGDENIPVYIWLEDIDRSEVAKEVQAKTGITKASINQMSSKMSVSNFETSEISSFKLAIGGAPAEVDLNMWKEATDNIRAELNQEVDTYIAAEREIAAEKHTAKNDSILDILDIVDDAIIFKSRYSPMVIAELNADKIFEIAKSSKVLSISEYKEEMEEIDYSEVTEVSSTSVSVTDAEKMAIHKAAIGLDRLSSFYNGKGIRIGQIDDGMVDTNDSDLVNSDITTLGSSVGIHATKVAGIMVGSSGIAPKATLVSMQLNDYYDTIELMLQKNVSIVNFSVGANRYEWYSAWEKWLDYMTLRYNVTFVIAAGNNLIDVTAPGLAYNVITVGGINDNLTFNTADDTIYAGSCYVNGGDAGCAKPDVIAPAVNFYEGWNGTSFAAPMVTGTIALMMQENPALKTDFLAVKAILLASCDRKVPGESLGGLTEKQGAGVINAQRAMRIIAYHSYKKGTANYLSNMTDDITVINTDSRFSMALAWNKTVNMYKDSSGIPNVNFEYPISNLSLTAYKLDGTRYTQIGTSSLSNSSTELINISRPTATGNKFKALVSKSSSSEYPANFVVACY